MATYVEDQRKINEGKYRALISRPVVHFIDAGSAPLGIEGRVEFSNGFLTGSSGVSAREVHLAKLIEERRSQVTPTFVVQLADLANGQPGQYAVIYKGHIYLVTIGLRKPGRNYGEHAPKPMITNLGQFH